MTPNQGSHFLNTGNLQEMYLEKWHVENRKKQLISKIRATCRSNIATCVINV